MKEKPGQELTFTPELDWLTLASYNFKAYCDMAAHMRSQYPAEWKRGNWLQYAGWKNKAGLFYGKALQSNDKEHFIMWFSGSTAAHAWQWIRFMPDLDRYYATRVDIQRTRSIPEWWVVRDLHDRMIALGQNSSMVQSETGSTLYMGNRKSHRFMRLYEKKLSEVFLRLEFELKSKHAKECWRHLIDGTSISDMYAYFLKSAQLPSNMVADYLPDNANDIDWKLAKRYSDITKQLHWLRGLLPTFEKMANDHDIGPIVRDIFYSLSLEHVDNGIETD